MDDPTIRRLVGGCLGRRFHRRVVTLTPGTRLRYVAAEWADAVVVVDRGRVEAEDRCGNRQVFAAGAVLSLAGLPLVAIRNVGDEAAVLVAVRRSPSTS